MALPLPVLCASVVVLLLWYAVKRHHRKSIAHLLGPPSESWLVGNIPNYLRAENAGDADFEWTQKYGLALCTKGCFGEDVLYLTDPKALQHILNKSAYNYPKPNEVRWRLRLTTGSGLAWADGTQHSRQRKIMNPAFSHPALKGFLPLFLDISRRTTDNWQAILRQQKGQSAVLDIASHLGNTTLDAVGEAAFGYKFNSIDGGKTDLYKAYHNLFSDTNYMMPDSTIAFRRLLGYLPLWMSSILSSLPKKDLKRLNHYMAVARRVAKEIIDKQMKSHMGAKEGGKDIMSIFVRANTSENPKQRLREDEILSQITLMLAGHETTANTLSWTLWELSKHPDVQAKLRDEVRATRADAIARGDKDVTIPDLDSMKYTGAVMKESLRYHPIALQLFRKAGRDDVIPLQTSQRTVSGETVTTIPVSKGQVIQLSLVGYNRLKSVWGEDADQWRPERFLEELPNEHKTNVGVSSNLITFSSGLRSCIGWRFSLIEMQSILVELIDKFEFSPAPGEVEMKRAPAVLMQPMVKGKESEGTQMPLTVTILRS